MKKWTTVIIVAVLGLVALGVVFIATWELPPPSATVEKDIPDDRFPR